MRPNHSLSRAIALLLAIASLLSLTTRCGADERLPSLPVKQPQKSSSWAVGLLQSLLNARLKGKTIAVDGKWGPETENATKKFQKLAKLTVNGRVDRKTWQSLFGSDFHYVVRFANRSPKKQYESTVELWEYQAQGGKRISVHRGSIMPDNMQVKGRIRDGVYSIHLGLHRRLGAKATAADLNFTKAHTHT